MIKNHKIKKQFASLLVALSAVLLIGCSGGSDSAQTSSQAYTLPSMQPTQSETKAEKPTQQPTTSETKPASRPTQSATEASTEDNSQIDVAFRPCNEVKYTTTRLNVRKAPSTSAPKVTILNKDTSVHCTGYSDVWTRILLNGNEYYVSSEFLTSTAPNTDLKPSDQPTKPVNPNDSFLPLDDIVYTTKKLNLRREPDDTNKENIVTTLPKDVSLHRVGSDGDWTRVEIDGNYYYVSSKFITTQVPNTNIGSNPGAGSTPTPDPNDPYLPFDDTVYTTAKLNLRAEPSSTGKIITVLAKGTALHRTGMNGEWTRVEVQGNICYVSSKYITTQGSATPDNPSGNTQTGQINRQETANGILYTGNAGPLIAIDPGHQAKANTNLEPIGPGSSETKKMVSAGTSGVQTRLAESQLNLIVSMRLCTELLNRGYNVLMIRESQEVNISNKERTERAAASGAAALIHVHANGSSNPEKRGAETLCPRNDNPFLSADLIAKSQNLAKLIIDYSCAKTGMQNLGLYKTNTMSGINWSTIPVTTIEMGYLSNAQDDAILITPEYQLNLVSGIADGFDRFFGR